MNELAEKTNTPCKSNTEEFSEKKIESTKRNNRVIYFDILNILACISVVFLHCNGIAHIYSEHTAWKTSLVVEVVCYWAVPVFLMLTGATLLKYRERYDTKTFFKKRLIKILIPWIVWSVVIYLIKAENQSPINFIKDFMNEKIEGIYWFFPLILYLYCLIPILSILTEKKEYRSLLKGIVIFIFIFRGVISPLCVIFNKQFPSILNNFIGANAYIIFLVLGYLLSTTELSKKKRTTIYILGIASALLRYFYTYFFSTKEGALNRDLFDYCSFASIFLAVAVFIFIKSIDWKKLFNKLHINNLSFISKLSSCSFGVYLIHIIIKDNAVEYLNLDLYSTWYRFLGPIVIYSLSVIIVYLLKKIPLIKETLP